MMKNELKSRFVFAFMLPVALAMLQGNALATDQDEEGQLALMQDLAPRLGPQEQLRQASRSTDQVRSILTKAESLLNQAKNERDVVKANCLNEKLTAIKGLLNVVENANQAIGTATAKNDTETGYHEFTKLTIASNRANELSVEAEGCVGVVAQYAGDTRLEVEINPEIRAESGLDQPDIELHPPISDAYPESMSPFQ